MVEAHVSAHESVAGRYRLLEVFARETNRLWWYAEDVAAVQAAMPRERVRGAVDHDKYGRAQATRQENQQGEDTYTSDRTRTGPHV